MNAAQNGRAWSRQFTALRQARLRSLVRTVSLRQGRLGKKKPALKAGYAIRQPDAQWVGGDLHIRHLYYRRNMQNSLLYFLLAVLKLNRLYTLHIVRVWHELHVLKKYTFQTDAQYMVCLKTHVVGKRFANGKLKNFPFKK